MRRGTGRGTTGDPLREGRHARPLPPTAGPVVHPPTLQRLRPGSERVHTRRTYLEGRGSSEPPPAVQGGWPTTVHPSSSLFLSSLFFFYCSRRPGGARLCHGRPTRVCAPPVRRGFTPPHRPAARPRLPAQRRPRDARCRGRRVAAAVPRTVCRRGCPRGGRGGRPSSRRGWSAWDSGQPARAGHNPDAGGGERGHQGQISSKTPTQGRYPRKMTAGR